MLMNELRVEELKQIANEHNGVLHPKDVVDHARDPDSALHDYFTWDDKVAGNKYRLWQARQLISVTYERFEIEGKTHVIYPVFTSLVGDRSHGGGYQLTSLLMKTPSGREAALESALNDLENYRRRYGHFSELAGIFSELDKAKKRVSRKSF